MPSRYVVQIAELESGAVVAAWTPRKPETDGDVIDALCARVAAKGVGIGRTEAHGLNSLREAWQELLHDLKAQV